MCAWIIICDLWICLFVGESPQASSITRRTVEFQKGSHLLIYELRKPIRGSKFVDVLFIVKRNIDNLEHDDNDEETDEVSIWTLLKFSNAISFLEFQRRFNQYHFGTYRCPNKSVCSNKRYNLAQMGVWFTGAILVDQSCQTQIQHWSVRSNDKVNTDCSFVFVLLVWWNPYVIFFILTIGRCVGGLLTYQTEPLFPNSLLRNLKN